MTEDARAFMQELQGRRDEYQAILKAGGITRELRFLARIPSGDAFVSFLESPDLDAGLAAFVESREEFDMWFKGRLADSTGIDSTSRATTARCRNCCRATAWSRHRSESRRRLDQRLKNPAYSRRESVLRAMFDEAKHHDQ